MDAEEIANALLSAYSSEAKLREFVLYKMERNLAEIAKGDDLREVVYKLVDHYQRRGTREIWELIANAALANPNNDSLATLMLRGPLTQSRPKGEAHRMSSNSYGEEIVILQQSMEKLREQIAQLDKTFTVWQTSAQYANESNLKRLEVADRERAANREKLVAIEREIEAIDNWRAAMREEMAMTRAAMERFGVQISDHRPMLLPRWQLIAVAAFMTLVTLGIFWGLYLTATGAAPLP